MTTNSADPLQLLGFAQSIDGIAAAVDAAVEQAGWALARYRRDCAEVPVESRATAHAADALDRARQLTGGTRRVATAFQAADRGNSIDGVRTADDATFASALQLQVRRHGGTDITPGDGVVVDGDADWAIGADGLTGTAVGSILVGYRSTRSVELQVGPVTSHHEVEATVGITADGKADLTVGPGGAALHAEGEVFAGGRVDTRHTVELGVCTVELEGTAAMGVGAGAEVDASIGRDGFEVDGRMFAVVGVGGGGGGSVSCRPPSLQEAERWVDDRVDDIRNAPRAVGDAIDAVEARVAGLGRANVDLGEVIAEAVREGEARAGR